MKKFLPMIAFNASSIIFLILGYEWYSIIPSAVFWWYFSFINRKVVTVLITVAAGACLLLSHFFNIYIALIPGYIVVFFMIMAIKMLIKNHREIKLQENLQLAWVKNAKKELENPDGSMNFTKRLKLTGELNEVLNHKSNKGKFKNEEGNDV